MLYLSLEPLRSCQIGVNFVVKSVDGGDEEILINCCNPKYPKKCQNNTLIWTAINFMEPVGHFLNGSKFQPTYFSFCTKSAIQSQTQLTLKTGTAHFFFTETRQSQLKVTITIAIFVKELKKIT